MMGKIIKKLSKMLQSANRKISQLSLQKKLVGLYIFIILIPIMAFTLFYTRQVFDSVLKDIKNKNEYLLEIEKIHIMNNIESMRRTAQMVVADREFIDFVKTRNETNISELIDFKMNEFSDVTKLQVNNPTIEHIHLYTSNPYVTEMWPILFSENRVLFEPWREEVLNRNGRELWWFDQNNDILGRLMSKNSSKVSVLRELDYPKDEHLGIIEISMLLNNFFPKMFSTVNDGSSELIVFDPKKNIISSPYNSFLEDEKINLNKLKKQFVKNQKQAPFHYLFKNGDTVYMIVSTYLDGLDSYMLNVISLEEVYKETTKTRYIVFSGILVLVGILSLLTFLLTSILFKKMFQLIESMKEVEKGDFSVEVDINGHGEIGQLATHYRNMLNKIKVLIADAVNKQAATKEAELKALKTQIDSHFLYNTLENIKMMAEIDGNYQISDAVTSLGEMMRYNLKWKNDIVSCNEEIAHIQNYIDIMNLRLDGLLTLKVDLPPQLLEQEILKMSLQPIVENAVIHGVRPNIPFQPGIIHVKANVEEETIFIQIIDNGIGMTDEKLKDLNNKINSELEVQETNGKGGNGIGLRNVNERIQLRYGKEYGMSITSSQTKGTIVTIKLPHKNIKGAN
jgi:two-component system, sensor histidine kinase YesM